MPAAIISDYNDHPPIKDVIYVVEDSVNLSAFFDDLLSTYLVKALEHFNGGSHTSVERAWASIECSTTFTLVLVKSTDFRPDLITTFRGPFTSAKRFFNALENISFVGKKSRNLQKSAMISSKKLGRKFLQVKFIFLQVDKVKQNVQVQMA